MTIYSPFKKEPTEEQRQQNKEEIILCEDLRPQDTEALE